MQAITPSILSWQVEESSEESAGSSNLSKLLMKGAQVAIQSDKKMSQVQLLQSLLSSVLSFTLVPSVCFAKCEIPLG